MEEYKSYIKNILRGYDNSLGGKGLMNILSTIESNTSISESDIHSKFNIWVNMIILALRRRNKRGQENWLMQNTDYILKMLYIYRALFNSVYKVDSSLLSWYRNTSDMAIALNSNAKIIKEAIILYDDKAYFVENNSDNICFRTIEKTITPESGLSFEYVYNQSLEDRKISCICDCTSCPRYKQSMEKAYNDDGKQVYCSADDCNKCEKFKQRGILRPIDCEDLYNALIICINANEYKGHSSNINYEHIPMPMRTDDVIIYFGNKKENDNIKNFMDKFKKDNVMLQDRIPSSHASPREHERKGGSRVGYTDKNGRKVRPTTFKATTVNKGNIKTSYKLKERK